MRSGPKASRRRTTRANQMEQPPVTRYAVITDSASYLPEAVKRRFGIYTVPLAVLIDGREEFEFETIDAATFYAAVRSGSRAASARQRPDRFIATYDRAVADGAEEIVAVHAGSNLSSAMTAATLACHVSEVPVHLVDTHQISFVEGLIAWEIAEALEEGLPLKTALARGVQASESVGNVFVTSVPSLATGLVDGPGEGAAVPVLVTTRTGVEAIGRASTWEAASQTLLRHIQRQLDRHPGKVFRIGIGDGDATANAEDLFARVQELARGHEVVRFTIGPVAGVFTGAGGVAAAFLPRPVSATIVK